MDGLDVRFRHYRTPQSVYEQLQVNGTRAKPEEKYLFYYSPDYGFDPESEYANEKPAVRGGMTICTIENGDQFISAGVSHCSFHDNFCYRIGREIARGRALSKMDNS